MSRGNRKKNIFEDVEDYVRFLDIVQDAQEMYGFTVHAICLMTNHFHIEIETSEVALSRIMQRIKSLYAEDFNYRHHYSGHLFEGRYNACLILNDRYFLEVSRYIHLNPVKAGMVREPAAYEYSSYGAYAPCDEDRPFGKAGKMIEDLVDRSRVLHMLADSQVEAREQYRLFVEGRASHEEHETLIRKEIGENEFWMPW
jgi:REP element-mobilizing transposase RayT